MDLDTHLHHGTLQPDFPLPVTGPFTLARAREADVGRHDLDRLCREGLLRRPVRGVYLPTHLGDSLALRAACLRLVVPEDCVVVDRHAGWMLGAQMVLAPGEHLDLRPLSMFRPSGHGRLRNGLSRSGERNLTDEDVVEVHGMRVTTALRTAWDLGRVRWTDEAIAGLDAMFRLGDFSAEEFLAGMERFRGMRWVTTLRATGPLADGRSESPGESVLRLRCHEAGLHVTPQVEVHRDGRLVARLDLADEELGLAFEYDGVEWHSSPAQLHRDRRRRSSLARDGWVVESFGTEQVFGRARSCDAVLRAAARQARAARGLRRAG
ncbi:MAG: type IV toxin-antitoxin system AbiEi family antitoxin domain-containing protein [Nocardioides sp.]